jgi:hypothetical protein
MTNTWEDLYGLDKFSPADASLDLDSDGQTNSLEYLAGTNPSDGSDFLKLSIARVTGGAGFMISFLARTGKTYVIEYKNALSDPAWQTLLSIPAQGSDTVISHTDPTVLTERYYRLKTPGP